MQTHCEGSRSIPVFHCGNSSESPPPPVNTFLYVGNFFAGFECYFFKEEELLGSVLLTVELSTEIFVSLPVKFTHADTVRNSTLACEFTSALWPE